MVKVPSPQGKGPLEGGVGDICVSTVHRQIRQSRVNLPGGSARSLRVENLSQKGWDWWMMGADLGVGAPTGQASAIAGQGHYPCAKGESDVNFFPS